MRRLLCLTTLFLSTVTCAAPASTNDFTPIINGMYITGALGFDYAQHNMGMGFTLGNATANLNKMKYEDSFAPAIAVGYETLIKPDFSLATELRFIPLSQKNSISLNFLGLNDTQISITRNMELDLVTKPTIFLTPTKAFYSLFGLGYVTETGKITITADSAPESLSATTSSIIPIMGAGYRQFFNSRLSGFFEVTGKFYPYVEAEAISTSSGSLVVTDQPTLIWGFQAGLAYHFA